MSSTLQTGGQKAQATCALCGRALGRSYYFMCHVCGTTYCYAHMPVKCDHRKVQRPTPARLQSA